MRIAVLGSGGVGGYFGGRLASAGEDVTFIARGEHLQALRTTGLTVDSIAGNFRIHPAKATADPAEVGPVDLVVLGVKAWQVQEAARAMKPMVGPATTVLPLQNGVGAVAQLASELGQESVIGGLCRIVSFLVEPGHVRHAGFEPSVTFGEHDNRRSDRILRIQQAFTTAGVKATIAEYIDVALWRKFLFIAAFSGVGAVSGVPAGILRSNPETRELLLKAMNEIYDLARARNIQLPSYSVDKAMSGVDSLPVDAVSSMQRDIAAGKPSELEAQNGAVVLMARESGVEVPTHEFIYDRLLPQERKARGEFKSVQVNSLTA